MMTRSAFLEAFFLLALSSSGCHADELHGLLRNARTRHSHLPVHERNPSAGNDDNFLQAKDLAATQNDIGDFWEGRLLMFQSMATPPPTEPPITSPSDTPSTQGNDKCTEAMVLTIGDTVAGSTYGATSDTLPSCIMTANQAAGFWYKFQGNGSPLLVSTCLNSTGDTYVSVYHGSSCGQLECLPSYFQVLHCGSILSYGGSSVAMESISNVTYYVHVSNRYVGNPTKFFLSVSAYMKPSNDQCSTAVDITVDAEPIRGTIRRWTNEADTPITPCGSVLLDGGGMAWYRITPTKDVTLRASTCSDGTSAMHTGLTVVAGDCDGQQICLTETVPYSFHQNCGIGGSSIDFDVVADGRNYFILVWGPMLGDLGFVELGIRSLKPPDNDGCEAAAGLIVGGPDVTGTLYDSTGSVDEQNLACIIYPYDGYGGGVWYSFPGTGDIVSVSLCSDGEQPFISIYEGECGGSLTCLAPTRVVIPEGCTTYGSKSSPLQTIKGVTYHVLVSSWAGAVSDGSFTLSIKTVTPPSNYECSGAFEVVPADDVRVVGNTVDAFHDKSLLQCASGSPALWYLVRGTGEGMRADTCSNHTFLDTIVSVVEGPCDAGNSICIVSNDDSCDSYSSSVAWRTERGVDYYIRVSGREVWEVGEFGLQVATYETASNDACSDAIKLTVGVTVGASMEGASPGESTPDCFSDSSTAGIWYYVDGLESSLVISTCDPAGNSTFSGSIQVFKGSSCLTGLECIPFSFGNDCRYSSSASVKFLAQGGERYYILFLGSWDDGSEENNSFVISVTEDTSPTNDKCSAAIEVIPDGDARIIGNTVDVIYDESSLTCTNVTSRSPALWYLVRGTGGMMRADTCSNYTDLADFDTVISVLEGPCGVNNSSCLVSNDDSCGSLSSSVVWSTELGVDYYIRVGAAGEGGVGEFGLRVSTFEAAPNDACSGAIQLTTGVTMSASMKGASPGDSFDCFYDTSTPGIWYYIDGLGKGLAISTGDPSGNRTFSGVIEVFQGTSCSSGLVCTVIAYGSDCFCSSSASVKFLAEEGKRYYILFVDPWDRKGIDENKKFNITVTDFEPAENDMCKGAFRMDSSISIIGSTKDSLPDNTTCKQNFNPQGDAPGVWYAVQGTGKSMMASTCSSELSIDTALYVFSGSCEQLACVAGGTSSYDSTCEETTLRSSRVIFQTEVDLTYYLLVAGEYSSAVGDFGLSISDVDSPWNDKCTNATVIIPNNGITVGSTFNASSSVYLSDTSTSDEASCSFNPNSPGVWYSLNGTGHKYLISTCSNETTFETAISVLSGGCDRMECVTSDASNDSSCSSPIVSADAVLSTEIGIEYLIFVHAATDNVRGSFGLMVSSFDFDAE